MTKAPCRLLSGSPKLESWAAYSFIVRTTDVAFAAYRVHGLYSLTSCTVVSLYASELSVDVVRAKRLGGHKGEVELSSMQREALVPVINQLLLLGYAGKV